MRIAEPALVLEAVAKRSIKPNVRHPYTGERKEHGADKYRCSGKHGRAEISVRQVVRPSTGPWAESIAS
jgi:hypothetical protein